MGERLTEQQRELVEKNHNLIYEFAYRNKLNLDDYYDILAIGLCNAGIIYESDSGAFSTIANTCMENIVNDYWKHMQANRYLPDEKILSYNAPNSSDNSSGNEGYLNCFIDNNSPCDIVISNIMFKSFYNSLTNKEKVIVKLLVNAVPQVQIAERMGCSKQNVGYFINQIRKKLMQHLKNY